MLTDTLSDGLEKYRIGPKIRELRTVKNLGLAQLGDHTGLSAGMLSKIERGSVFPTLPTLLRIAMVFGVGLEHFFSGGPDAPVLEIVRRKTRLRLPNTTEKVPDFFFESLDFPVNERVIESYLAEFRQRPNPTDPHDHRGIEMIYVLQGAVELTIRGKSHQLDYSDSIYFDSGHPHSYRGLSEQNARALVVVSSVEP